MAVITRTPQQSHPSQLWYHIRLVPEFLVFPIIGVLFFLLNQPAWLAWLGQVVILLFVTRSFSLWRAWRAWQRGHYHRAERWSQVAGLIYPWSADVAYTRALIANAKGDFDTAYLWLGYADTLFPHRASTLIGLASIHANKQDWEKVRWYGLQALALDESLSAAYALLAQAHLKLQSDHTFIYELITNGLEHAQDSADYALLYTARAEASIYAPDSSNSALEEVLRVLNFCPSTIQAECLYRLGNVYRETEHAAAAIHEYERVAQVDPEGRWLGRAWRAQQEVLMQQ